MQASYRDRPNARCAGGSPVTKPFPVAWRGLLRKILAESPRALGFDIIHASRPLEDYEDTSYDRRASITAASVRTRRRTVCLLAF